MATTPSATSSRSAGTLSRAEAISTSARRASATALRNAMPPFCAPVLPLGAALVDGPGGVAHHDTDPRERDVELLGDDLADRDIDTLAHIHFAEIGDDIAIGLDRKPAVELVGGERRLDRAADFGSAEIAGDDERDDERAHPLEDGAAVDFEGDHDRVLQPAIEEVWS